MIEIKTKLKVILSKLKSFCATKENYKQGEKTTLRMGDNFQNIQAVHTTQCQENKQPNQKMGKRPKQTFLQRRHTDG